MVAQTNANGQLLFSHIHVKQFHKLMIFFTVSTCSYQLLVEIPAQLKLLALYFCPQSYHFLPIDLVGKQVSDPLVAHLPYQSLQLLFLLGISLHFDCLTPFLASAFF
ncbi:hypothetical protein Mapa_007365 [Marchantia paleacea]|nr:hypothetical protein Mapa_007365 [Marchantia paleacea]